MKNSAQTILCIDDDYDTCHLLEFMFKQIDYETTICTTAEKGLEEAEKGGYSAIILDNWFANTDGVEICRKIRIYDSKTPIIFFSGEARSIEKQKAMDAGASEYLIKPNDIERIVKTVINFIQK